jgi:putative copper resistance protein D
MLERVLPSRPIPSGWAFFLPIVLLIVAAGPVLAQHGATIHESGHDHGGSSSHTIGPQWEGSLEGIAYSDRNHHVAGLLVLLIGLTELREALAITLLAWARFLLPAAMLSAGSLLMVWSDHDAWPIGSLNLAETFSGTDHEILQHKIYGILALAVGLVEWLRRAGHLRHTFWNFPLPAFAVIGGLMLFLHSHGIHPSAQAIALNHAVMGTMAIVAGSCKLISARASSPSNPGGLSRWKLAWAGFVLLIGLQLLLYSE